MLLYADFDAKSRLVLSMRKAARFLLLGQVGTSVVLAAPRECGCTVCSVSEVPCLTSSSGFALQQALTKLPLSLAGVSWVIN